MCHLMFDSKFFTCFHVAWIKSAILGGVNLDAEKKVELIEIEKVCFKTALSFLSLKCILVFISFDAGSLRNSAPY